MRYRFATNDAQAAAQMDLEQGPGVAL